ncbi:MAG: xanthine dehydrogenase family protein [Candidatus Eiseniibacteriota bacterium]|nr:MAG: xanthine dehydrogenase family protein [Candidatus Eisenbacteria bacterium]
MPAPRKKRTAFAAIGTSVPNVDAVDKVTGRAKYGADHDRKGQLYGRVKYSEHPHALILSIDVSRAVNLSGVRAVLTHADIPGENSFGTAVPHQVVLCSEKVRYLGDVVAIVAADSEEIAAKAVESITVKYKILPVVSDPVEALSPRSPAVHAGGNLCVHQKVRKGDVGTGFSQSEVVLEREYATQKVEHAYMEPEAVLAEPGENGGITVTGSVQNLYSIRRGLARVLALPLGRVRVRQATLGGSFGGKDEAMTALCCRAALLALKTGRPVKMVNTRENSMRESYKRHPYRMKYKVGADRRGFLKAMEITIHADAGAYAAMSPFVTWRSTVQATGPYVVPNVRTDVYAAYTNNCYTSAMRGFGSPQVCFGSESLMDELAEKLGMDPLEVRLKNTLRGRSTTATGQKLNHTVSVGEALLNVTKKGRFLKTRASNRKHNERSHPKKGVGISCSYRGVSLGAEGVDAAGVTVSLQTDGSVVASSGLVDMGQGAATTISLMVAEELGVTVDRIRFLGADTSRLPDSGPTVASRTSFMAGQAARRACKEIVERIRPVASEVLGCPVDSLLFRNNWVSHSTERTRRGPGSRKAGRGRAGRKRLRLGELASLCFARGVSLFAHGWYRAPATSWDERTGQGDAYFTFVYGANLAEVEVDTETGTVRVTRFVSSHDVGRVLNLNGARGQVYGGVAMGLGYALFEEYAEQDGRPSLENFDEYLLPTVSDVPETEIVFIENPDRLGPYGAKSLGEPACEIAAPAIANAVCDALGMRVRELPLTLERVRLGRGLSRKEKRGSAGP